jgi:hypothetical protein
MPDGTKGLLIYTKNKKERLTVSLKQKTGVPEKIEFDVKGNKGEIKINQWDTNAVAQDELFVEPGDNSKIMEVRQKNLDRVFAAFLNQGLEMAK